MRISEYLKDIRAHSVWISYDFQQESVNASDCTAFHLHVFESREL